MFLRTRPVRFLITRVARAYGFLDPIALLASLRGFAQPSEVAEPIELLRAGMLFHARGLVNTKAIQNNLDWVWPYWVERQFNPNDPSFIPRAFSFSHINLTHRNWTAVGVPDVPFYPIVDPRGLVTPQFDGWSLDFWFVPDEGPELFPSKLAEMEQHLALQETLEVRSVAVQPGIALQSVVTLVIEQGEPICHIRVSALSGGARGSIALAVRPYNPEGVSFIKTIEVLPDGRGWMINGRNEVFFDRAPSKHLLSTYSAGDVSLRLREAIGVKSVTCPVSMATAVALFPLNDADGSPCEIRVPIYDELEPKRRPTFKSTESWQTALAPLARLRVDDSAVQRLYDLGLANLVMHAPGEVYPGPYTYKRFWFRDAVFILNSLLSLGGVERTRRAMREFEPRQRLDGYFLSQEGEWDSNGEALWFYHRFAALTGEAPSKEALHAIAKGARWITRKRLPMQPVRPESGLLPAGFSAEHLGPNDYYYWDDFWAVAGLRAAATLLRATDPQRAGALIAEAEEFFATIRRSFPSGPHRRYPGAMPASPHRRMDGGAVGSLVADYPLQLFAPGDSWITKTADYLCETQLQSGGFFQNMIHSGINAYLTLHLAQVRLRSGDPAAAWKLMDAVVALASPTGQWPEAIHPLTRGGCMGDGQHIWAAAEWLMFIRNLFVREEADALIIGSGVKAAWFETSPAEFGPTLTPCGSLRVAFENQGGAVKVRVDGAWRTPAPRLELRVPGFTPLSVGAADSRTEFILHSSQPSPFA
jgi:hypothetical protein